MTPISWAALDQMDQSLADRGRPSWLGHCDFGARLSRRQRGQLLDLVPELVSEWRSEVYEIVPRGLLRAVREDFWRFFPSLLTVGEALRLWTGWAYCGTCRRLAPRWITEHGSVCTVCRELPELEFVEAASIKQADHPGLDPVARRNCLQTAKRAREKAEFARGFPVLSVEDAIGLMIEDLRDKPEPAWLVDQLVPFHGWERATRVRSRGRILPHQQEDRTPNPNEA